MHPDRDGDFMREALSLARMGLGRTSPNPMVGAVVVRDGQVVGRGFHPKAGEPHAEIFALHEAGDRARGATLYITLEPCCHRGRTGPCTEAIIAAGVTRVVAATEDPDSRVNGAGLARLREAGVEVALGVLREAAEQLNEAYGKHRRLGLPFITLKWAMSLDGKTALCPLTATRITGDAAHHYVHELRNTYDAILVGINTVLADDPLLTCRLPSGRDPLRVVLDSQLRLPLSAKILTLRSSAPTLVVTTAAAPPAGISQVRATGAEVLVAEGPRPRVRWICEQLAARGVLSVLVEGGGTVHAALLEEGLADKIVALITPLIFGGRDAPTPVEGSGVASLMAARRLERLTVTRLGDDVVLEGYVRYPVQTETSAGELTSRVRTA